MSQTVTAPVEAASKPNLSELSGARKACTTSASPWPTTCGGVGSPRSSTFFAILDPIRWRQLDHNPIALLGEFTPERLEMRAAELVLYSRINYAFRRLKEYMASNQTWARRMPACWARKPVAYFSAEFGIHESVPIYSGGLGVLSGDHVKSASGSGHSACGRSACSTTRAISSSTWIGDGYQHEEYLDTKVENVPMEPGLGVDGKHDHRGDRNPHRQAAGQGLADARRPREAVSARLRRRGQQPRRPRADQPAVRRRPPHPHPPGAGAGRRRRQGARRPWASRRACTT